MDNIPKLPGYNVTIPPCLENKNLGRKQTLTYLKGYQHKDPDMAGLMSADGAGRASPAGRSAPTGSGFNKTADSVGSGSAGDLSSMATGSGSRSCSPLPKWVEQDRQVLRFYGYFREAVTESNIENHRVRRVVVLYYLADDTMQVIEPKQDNSGIQQGVFVRRHQIDKEDGSGRFSIADLAVGQTVTLYGRTIVLLDADTFTRNWYAENMGTEQAPAGGYPEDPVEQYREHFGLTSSPSEWLGLCFGMCFGLACVAMQWYKVQSVLQRIRDTMRSSGVLLGHEQYVAEPSKIRSPEAVWQVPTHQILHSQVM
eukprot:GHRR01014124.1.p1 GENE.GHRR01014124.1~~GHRR01014124.1.p1  ORF type:complete len:312 (+),score=105.18 GHRR01014124.1:163-1098(+)